MRLLQSKPDSQFIQDGLLKSGWPARHNPNRAVQIEQRGSESVLKLCEWNGNRFGKELARAIITFDDAEPSGLFGELLVIKTCDNKLYAFSATASTEKPWKPVWTFDLLLNLPRK
jgi:hypothetical protein